MGRKNWDVVKDSEEWEAFRNAMREKHDRGEKLTPAERGRLGGLATRENYGFSYYQRISRLGHDSPFARW